MTMTTNQKTTIEMLSLAYYKEQEMWKTYYANTDSNATYFQRVIIARERLFGFLLAMFHATMLTLELKTSSNGAWHAVVNETTVARGCGLEVTVY